MKLYNVYYHGKDMDSSVRFPSEATADIKRVVNVNWNGEEYIVAPRYDTNEVSNFLAEADASDCVPPRGLYGPDCDEFIKAIGISCRPYGFTEEGRKSNAAKMARRLGYWFQQGKPNFERLEFVEVTSNRKHDVHSHG